MVQEIKTKEYFYKQLMNDIQDNRFFIIVTGYNCEAFVKKCYDSIMKQTYSNYHFIFNDDRSTDFTLQTIQDIGIKDWQSNDLNMGAAYSRHHIINYYADENDIILFLGMDDELLPNALERINEEYKQGKLMTYGNWYNQFGEGLPLSFNLDFTEQTHKERNYRQVTYRSTAPNTFRKFLYNCIKEEDLKLTHDIEVNGQFAKAGTWFNCCTEGEVMFSCLEQCGKERIGIIRDYIYLYNESTAALGYNNHNGTLRRFGREFKYRVLDQIRAKPKRELWQ